MSSTRGALSYLVAIGHKGFSAGSNLILTVMAGRALDAASFGEFALFMATVSLLLIPHASFFSEPMLVYGPRDYKNSLRRYLLALAGSQLGFALLCALAACGLALAYPGQGYLSFGLAIPLALTLEFQVRSFFMQLRPVIACLSAILQFATLCLVLFLGQGLFAQSVDGFLQVFIYSLIVANLFLLGMHLLLRGNMGRDALEYSEVAARHLRFAGWALVSHLMLFLVTNFYIYLLPVLQDLVTTANFRAQSAITGPGVQAFSALGMMAVPMLRVCDSKMELLQKLKKLLLIVTAIGLPVLLVAGIWGRAIIDMIYAGKYGLLPVGYWLAGAYPLAIGYAFIMGSALRAMDRANLVALAAGIAAGTNLPVGIWLAWAFGAEGVIFAQVLGAVTMSVACALFLLRHTSISFETRGPNGFSR